MTSTINDAAAMHFCIGASGFLAALIVSQVRQVYFGVMCSMTLICAGINSNCSDLSSPILVK
jgi:hypothetical protein